MRLSPPLPAMTAGGYNRYIGLSKFHMLCGGGGMLPGVRFEEDGPGPRNR